MAVLVLAREQVEALLDVDLLLDRLERAFVELSAGRASVPPRVAAFAPDGFLAAMPGYIDGVLEAKLVSVFPGHEPSHEALIAVFDAETGTPRAVMDGTHLTAVRTGASSAVATRALAREDARVLAVLGAGVQGWSHLDAVRRVRDFDEVRVASRTHEHAEALAAETGATAVESFEDAVRGADVVCCCTHAGSPVLRRDWLDPGTHVCSVGVGDGPELDKATVNAGLLVVESSAAFEPFPAGAHELSGLDPSIAVELGQILSGDRPGRSGDEQITVYKSMGHAVEDAAAAALVLERAQG
ncbi:MAG: ornithine cyclodeaminase family protein [Gaiellaceae bacterium]|jgi:alanine dehydrogenase